MKILSRAAILDALGDALTGDPTEGLARLVAAQEAGFVALSRGHAVVPAVFHLPFDSPHPGDLHIKGARLRDGAVYAVKLAAGFPENPARHGIPASQGMMLVGCARTGAPLVLLQDEGFLTDLRTALAGRIAAQHLGPPDIDGIGILGSGVQARLQARYLRSLTPCRRLHLWGRTPQRVRACASDLAAEGFEVRVEDSPGAVARRANLIVTTTAATAPLLTAADLGPGTHVTAVGADAPGKQELAADVFRRARPCVVDSRSQCVDHGDSHFPVRDGVLAAADLVELGQVIADPSLGRIRSDEITVADLTGVGVQDLQIAVAVAAPWLPDQGAVQP